MTTVPLHRGEATSEGTMKETLVQTHTQLFKGIYYCKTGRLTSIQRLTFQDGEGNCREGYYSDLCRRFIDIMNIPYWGKRNRDPGMKINLHLGDKTNVFDSLWYWGLPPR